MSDQPFSPQLEPEPFLPPQDAAEILRLAERLVDKAKPIADKYRRIASVNEQFVQGNQWSAPVFNNGRLEITEDAWFDAEGVPRIAVNHLGNLVNTWVSLLTKDRLTAVAEPASDEPEDTYRSEVAQRVIEYIQREQDTAGKQQQAVKYACMHGTGGLKVYYDPRRDEVVWAPLTLFNYFIDPKPDYRDARWCILENWLDEDEAIGVLEQAGYPRQQPRAQRYKNAANEELEGVLQWEVWVKPNREWPSGLYASIVDGKVVDVMEFPYVFETDAGPEYILPIFLMKVRDVRESAYGQTNVTDCVPLQRSFNEIIARLVKTFRVTSQVHRLIPKALLEEFDPATDTDIGFDKKDLDLVKAIGFTQPPEVGQNIYDLRDFFRQSMFEVIGINEITSGTESRSLSGKAIENIVELDATKNSDARKQYEAMVLDALRFTLLLIGRFYTTQRKIRITNDTAADVVSFSNADVQGVDIRLEPGSEIDTLTARKEEQLVERKKVGLASELDWKAVLDKPGHGLSKMQAEDLVQRVLAGETVDVYPEDLNMDVLEATVAKHKARAMAEGRREDWLALNAFQGFIRDLKADEPELRPKPPAQEQAPQQQPPPQQEVMQ